MAATRDSRFTTDLAAQVADDVLERFLRYVRIDTQSDPDSTTYPSTAKQLDLSRLLVEELRGLGVEDARLDGHGYVMATLPATVEEPAPTIGLVAHVDTSPVASGTDVRPHVHRPYAGGEVALPGDPRIVLSPEDSPELADHVGHDLVTSDGTTLLGADDKAGVAEIMAAVAHLAAHPEIPHGPVAIGFTPDEEVGAGTRHFDIEAFGAAIAYTLDGSTAGELQDETFSASQVTVRFEGRGTHPGSAKGVLVNALKLAAELVSRLPADTLSPETTDGREPYVHPARIHGSAEATRVELIVRSFDDDELAELEEMLRRLAEEVALEEPRARVQVEVETTYRNMKRYLDEHPRALEAAEEAMRRTGLSPRRASIRGGTDGSRLSELGLPTPNLFTGGHAYHSLTEWVCVQDMADAVAMVVHLVQIWAE